MILELYDASTDSVRCHFAYFAHWVGLESSDDDGIRQAERAGTRDDIISCSACVSILFIGKYCHSEACSGT